MRVTDAATGGVTRAPHGSGGGGIKIIELGGIYQGLTTHTTGRRHKCHWGCH